MVKNISIILVLIVAVAAVALLKNRKVSEPASPTVVHVDRPATSAASQVSSSPKALPRLVDLGADKCIPCKMMAPILEEMKKEYSGRMEVEFIDVWENREAGGRYGIRAIPTQIYYDENGKELYRHEGFFPKEAMMNKWKELGYDFSGASGKG